MRKDAFSFQKDGFSQNSWPNLISSPRVLKGKIRKDETNTFNHFNQGTAKAPRGCTWRSMCNRSPYKHCGIHPWRFTNRTVSWRLGRSFSFLNRWFVGSMLIFQGVVVLGCLMYRKFLPRVDAYADVREVYIDKLLFHLNNGYVHIHSICKVF